MSAWGTGIFDDDTTCDVRDSFLDYLDQGKTVEEATAMVLEEYLDEFDPDEEPEMISLVYIGLSAIQMEKHCLQAGVRQEAIKFIEHGADLELWGETSEENYVERQQILNDFKQQLVNYK